MKQGWVWLIVPVAFVAGFLQAWMAYGADLSTTGGLSIATASGFVWSFIAAVVCWLLTRAKRRARRTGKHRNA